MLTAQEGLREARLGGEPGPIPRLLNAVASAALGPLRVDEARDAAEQAKLMPGQKVQALLRGGHESQARELVMVLTERTSGDEDQRRMHLVTYRMKAALHRWEGDEASAVRELEQALELAQSLNVPGELWQISAELAATHALVGDRTKAAEMFKVSRKTIDALAHGITDPTLHKSFRSSALRLINASAG